MLVLADRMNISPWSVLFGLIDFAGLSNRGVDLFREQIATKLAEIDEGEGVEDE